MKAVKDALSCHYKICTAANGNSALSSAYKEARRQNNATRTQKLCEQAGRNYKPGCGAGNGDVVNGLQLFMDSFTKTELKDTIRYVPIHLRLWFFWC